MALPLPLLFAPVFLPFPLPLWGTLSLPLSSPFCFVFPFDFVFPLDLPLLVQVPLPLCGVALRFSVPLPFPLLLPFEFFPPTPWGGYSCFLLLQVFCQGVPLSLSLINEKPIRAIFAQSVLGTFPCFFPFPHPFPLLAAFVNISTNLLSNVFSKCCFLILYYVFQFFCSTRSQIRRGSILSIKM